jgi:hypothetical protein
MTISDHDAAAIRQATANFCKAVSTDDLEAMVAIATDDCLVFPPNEAGHSGKVGSRKWHEARMAQFTTNLEMSSQELLELANWHFIACHFVSSSPRSLVALPSRTPECAFGCGDVRRIRGGLPAPFGTATRPFPLRCERRSGEARTSERMYTDCVEAVAAARSKSG